jgi:hypothetical protein
MIRNFLKETLVNRAVSPDGHPCRALGSGSSATDSSGTGTICPDTGTRRI